MKKNTGFRGLDLQATDHKNPLQRLSSGETGGYASVELCELPTRVQEVIGNASAYDTETPEVLPSLETIFLFKSRTRSELLGTQEQSTTGLAEFRATKKQHEVKFDVLSTATWSFAASRVIGRGNFGTVYLGKINGLEVAVKVDKELNGEDIEQVQALTDVAAVPGATGLMEHTNMEVQFVREATFLYSIRHRNICTLLGHSLDGPHRSLLFEYCPRGSLGMRLSRSRASWETRERTGRWSEQLDEDERSLVWLERIRIAHGCAAALAFLHTAGKLVQNIPLSLLSHLSQRRNLLPSNMFLPYQLPDF
jgi:hypothetical protein